MIEQENLYRSFALNQNNGDGNGYKVSDNHPNAFAVNAEISTFLCPSDQPNRQNEIILGSANPAPGSYAGNAGWAPLATGFEGERSAPGTFNGVISLHNPSFDVNWHSKTIGFGAISDGTSNTAMVSERLIQQGNSGDAIKAEDKRLSRIASSFVRNRYQVSTTS